MITVDSNRTRTSSKRLECDGLVSAGLRGTVFVDLNRTCPGAATDI